MSYPDCVLRTLQELRDECRRLALPEEGTKIELCRRLQEYYNSVCEHDENGDLLDPITGSIIPSNRVVTVREGTTAYCFDIATLAKSLRTSGSINPYTRNKLSQDVIDRIETFSHQLEELRQKFTDALRRGHQNLAIDALNAGLEPDDELLAAAVAYHREDTVRALLEAGAQVNGGLHKYPPIYSAFISHLPIAKLLIDYGADINETVNHGRDNLMTLQRGALTLEQIDFLIENEFKFSPGDLYILPTERRDVILERLRDHGLPNPFDEDRLRNISQRLDLAIKEGSYNDLLYVLDTTPASRLNEPLPSTGRNALQSLLLERPHEEKMVELLLTYLPDVSSDDIALARNPKIRQILRDHLEKSLEDHLSQMASLNREEQVVRLIQEGANPNMRVVEKTIPPSYTYDEETVEPFVDGLYIGPLNRAIRKGHWNIVEYLIEDVPLDQMTLDFALAKLVTRERGDSYIQMLIDHGANRDTAVDLLIDDEPGRRGILKLTKNGADPTRHNGYPITLAGYFDLDHYKELIERHGSKMDPPVPYIIDNLVKAHRYDILDLLQARGLVVYT